MPVTKENPEVIRMKRKVAVLEEGYKQLQLKLSRAEAEKTIVGLKNEGIIFGDTPEDAAEGEADDLEYLTQLTNDERDYYVNNVIKKRYKRKKPNPAVSMNGNGVGLARFSRGQVDLGKPGKNGVSGGEEIEDFEPETAEEAVMYSDLISEHVHKLSRKDATKVMMKRRREQAG